MIVFFPSLLHLFVLIDASWMRSAKRKQNIYALIPRRHGIRQRWLLHFHNFAFWWCGIKSLDWLRLRSFLMLSDFISEFQSTFNVQFLEKKKHSFSYIRKHSLAKKFLFEIKLQYNEHTRVWVKCSLRNFRGEATNSSLCNYVMQKIQWRISHIFIPYSQIYVQSELIINKMPFENKLNGLFGIFY